MITYHLGGRLGMECGRRWLGVFLAQSSRCGKINTPKCTRRSHLICSTWQHLVLHSLEKIPNSFIETRTFPANRISIASMNIRLIALLVSFASNAGAFTAQRNFAHRPSHRALVAPPLDMTSSGDNADTSQTLLKGTVKFFSKKKGYGFIIPDGGGEDVFAHQEHIKMDGFRFLTPNEKVHFKVAKRDEGNKIYATEIYKEGSIEDMAAMSHELEEAVHEVTLLEADAFGVAMDADQAAQSIDAAQHDESTMTIESAREIAEVEAKAKAIEEEVEDIAAHALPIMAVEQIASKLEEDKKKAEADEKAKVASSVDKTHPDPFHHLKSMFGL